MRTRWALAVLLVSFQPAPSAIAADAHFEHDIKRAFSECRAIESVEDRVKCYDALQARLSPPRWQGRLTLTTEPFKISEPTILRYESDGVIFVMYLRDDHDQVVQNLHIGGGGEDTYLIEKPGTYVLQINGAESWRVWLEPQASDASPKSDGK